MLPTRRTYAWLAVSVMIFAVYASLLPFAFRAAPFDDALRQFAAIMTTPARERIARTNFLANLLLFLPIGFGLAGARLVDRPRTAGRILAAAAVTLVLSLAVSLTAEFLQAFVPGRITSRSDVEAQAIGWLGGFLGWVAVGQPVTAWLRGAQAGRGHDRMGKALAAYAIVWTFVNLAPFDITVDPGELAARARAGLISLVPFAGPARPASRIVWDVVITTVSAVPLGALALVGWTRGRGRRRPSAAFALGAALVCAMEAAQIVVVSHAADVTDAGFGCLGVAVGVWIWGGAIRRSQGAGAGAGRVPRSWSAGAVLVWCGVLLGYHWMPYDFRVDPAALEYKLGNLSLVPFVNYARGSDLNAFNDLLVKLGLSAPLGVLAAFVAGKDGRPGPSLGTWLAAGAVLFTVIEAGQLFLPTRTPDPTDVLVGLAGAAAGLALGRWLQEA